LTKKTRSRAAAPVRRRRTATTARGNDVMDRVVEVARDALTTFWWYELTVVQIAREAGLARPSVLLQFPEGIPDIVCTVTLQELGRFSEDAAASLASRVNDPLRRTVNAFAPLFERADTSGRLYANMRSALVLWRDGFEGVFAIGRRDSIDFVAALLAGAWPQDPVATRRLGYAADAIWNLALDLCAGEGEFPRNAVERREAFSQSVHAILRGLKN
jgi:AcrR family transcriptional regulator